MRLILVPRWGGRPESDWYPWLRRQAAASGAFSDVVQWEYPDPDLPVIEDCVASLRSLLGDSVDRAQTTIVAHSVGAQVVLRTLAHELEPAPLHALVAVAGWFRVDDIRPTSAPWCEPIPHLSRAVAACGRLVDLASDDEPMIADWWSNAWAWAEAGAHVRVVEGAGHFMRGEEPVVWDAVSAAVGAPSSGQPDPDAGD